MAGLFDDRQKKKKETVQPKAQTKGSGNTASSSNSRQYGSFSDFFEARRQQEAVEDYKRWGKEAPARRTAIDGALRIAEQNRHKPSVPAAPQNNTQQNNAPAGMPSLKELADAAVAEQRKTDLQSRLVQQGQRKLSDQRRREVAREGYHPNQVKIDPAQISEFAKQSYRNTTPAEMSEGINAAQREANVKANTPLNKVSNALEYMRTYQTADITARNRKYQGVGTDPSRYEEKYHASGARQRREAIEAAAADPKNPLNATG